MPASHCGMQAIIESSPDEGKHSEDSDGQPTGIVAVEPMTKWGVLCQCLLLGETRAIPNLQVQVEKQVCSGIFAADGARSWCPVIPIETPTTPGRQLMSRKLVFTYHCAPAVYSMVGTDRLTELYYS